jgi:S-adenosylmethionine decarboxylase
MSLPSVTTAVLEDIAPEVFRQRLLIEGHFNGTMTEQRVSESLLALAGSLELQTYGDPVIFQPATGMGKEENAGFDAFVPLIDSGISGYFWTGPKFFSLMIYTCKGFDTDTAISTARDLFGVEGKIIAHSF